jgi:hypothetical protein
MPDLPAGAARTQPTPTEEAISAIRDYLKSMRFGSIALTVHDGKIVQLDVTEKRRLAS